MIPSRHRRRVLPGSDLACSRMQRRDRRHRSRDSQIRSDRHGDRGGDDRERVEFSTLFRLLCPNETVRAGSNWINHLRCLPSDFCLRKGGGVDWEDRNSSCNDCNDPGRGDKVRSVLSLPPSWGLNSRERNFRNTIGFLERAQGRGDNNPADGSCLICNSSANWRSCVLKGGLGRWPLE